MVYGLQFFYPEYVCGNLSAEIYKFIEDYLVK